MKQEMIDYYMSKLSDKKQCKISPARTLGMINALKEHYKDNEYIMLAINDLYLSEYSKKEYEQLKSLIYK